jgi:hypothetical protein
MRKLFALVMFAIFIFGLFFASYSLTAVYAKEPLIVFT